LKKSFELRTYELPAFNIDAVTHPDTLYASFENPSRFEFSQMLANCGLGQANFSD